MFWRRTQFSSLRPSYFCSCTIYSQSSPSICQLTPNNCLGTRRILQKLWGDWFPSSLNFFIKHFDNSSFPWQNEGDQAKVGNYLRNTQSLDFFLSLICLFFYVNGQLPCLLRLFNWGGVHWSNQYPSWSQSIEKWSENLICFRQKV